MTAALPVPVLIYLLTIAFPIGFPVGPLAMSGMRLLLLVMIVPLTIGLFTGRYGRLILTDFLFMGHIIWATIALAANNPDRVIENIGSSAIEFIGGYVLARAYIRTPEAFEALCKTLVFMIAALLPFAIYETKTDNPIILTTIAKLPGVWSFDDVRADLRIGLARCQAVFPHPILFGLFSSLGFSLGFVALKGIWSFHKRVILSGMVALCVFLSLSSGAILPLLLQIFLILWAWVFRAVKVRWFLLIGLFVAAYIAIDAATTRTPITVLMTYATFSPHNAWWRAAIFEFGMQNVWAHPVLGLGLKDWARPSWMHSSSIDNFWLVMAIRYGIPGFAFIAVGMAVAIFQIGFARIPEGSKVQLFRNAWMFIFLGLAFTLSTVHIWSTAFSFVFFLLGAGVWMAFYRPPAVEVAADAAGGHGAGEPGRGTVRWSRTDAAMPTARTIDRSPDVNPDSRSMNVPDAPSGPDRGAGLSFTRYPSGNGRQRKPRTD